jgi:hypothetical protein
MRGLVACNCAVCFVGCKHLNAEWQSALAEEDHEELRLAWVNEELGRLRLEGLQQLEELRHLQVHKKQYQSALRVSIY